MHLGLPSPAAFSVAQQPAAAASFRPVVRRRRAHYDCLCSSSPPRPQMLRPAETPRPPRRLAIVRAQNHVGDSDGDRPLPPCVRNSFYLYVIREGKTHNFPKEERHISSHIDKLNRVVNGLLNYMAGDDTRCLCRLANNAVNMASHIVDSASLNHPTTTPAGDGSVEISGDTVHRTLGAYVQISVQTADDAFNDAVTKETGTSFLGALRGLASVAHILLQAALEGLGHEHPKESLSEYALNCDVKTMHRVYDRRMRELEDSIRNAPSPIHTCKILMPAICEGMEATESFVALMMARRKRTLEKTHSSKVVE